LTASAVVSAVAFASPLAACVRSDALHFYVGLVRRSQSLLLLLLLLLPLIS
jgi:hypothetical protein